LCFYAQSKSGLFCSKFKGDKKMAYNSKDVVFMQRALELARLAEGRTSPNPLVGCIIVQHGEIVGEGYHQKAGTPHAEIHALLQAGDKAKGSTVYVTLEPCSHYGRTPPCTDALIKAKVKRVVVAMEDPNPLVCGSGIRKLQEAGINVEVGLLEEKAKKINAPFIKAITKKLPFVLYKSALTLDGKTAVESGDSKWITSEGARQYAHSLRNIYDIIMVGSNTIIYDDPLLTCRGIANGRDPVKLIVDSSLKIPINANVFTSTQALNIIATTKKADPNKLSSLQKIINVEVWQYPTEEEVPLYKLMHDIVSRGWNSILLEGGGILAGKMLQEKLIDKIEFIFAPKLAGSGPSPLSGLKLSSMQEAIQLKDIDVCTIDGCFKFSGYVKYS